MGSCKDGWGSLRDNKRFQGREALLTNNYNRKSIFRIVKHNDKSLYFISNVFIISKYLPHVLTNKYNRKSKSK
jgi:hypothetical protein